MRPTVLQNAMNSAIIFTTPEDDARDALHRSQRAGRGRRWRTTSAAKWGPLMPR